MAMEDHHSAPIVVPKRDPCQFFFPLSNIPKDAEFQGLSESG